MVEKEDQEEPDFSSLSKYFKDESSLEKVDDYKADVIYEDVSISEEQHFTHRSDGPDTEFSAF